MQKIQIYMAGPDPNFLSCELPIAPERLSALMSIGHPGARLQSVTAELLLCWAVRTLRPADVPIPPVRQVTPQGKPYFSENPTFQFSISHSRDWVVLAAANVPVGVDLEYCGANRPQIVRRYFHQAEQDFFFSLPDRAQTAAFYDMWVLKESAVKALGSGLHLPLRTFSVSLDPLSITDFPEHAQLSLPDFCDPEYRLGVCALTDAPLLTTCQTVSPQELLFTQKNP